MTNKWSERYPIAFPVEHIEIANALAHLIDPDIGGAKTFSLDYQKSGYIYAEIPFVTEPDYVAIVSGRDFNTWKYVVNQLSEERGRPGISDEDLNILISTMKFGAEEFAELEEEIPAE